MTFDIERRKETAELLAIPGLYEKVWASSREFRRRKSLSLVDARKKLENAASGEARGLLRTRH
jgi:hypothetical protein